mmetsp:Transcript_59271/g.117742  ORF Transcript_59271/g.117742 Transcript_59271/m.117742 type:complete len:203 (+) Transcript_59271:1111-1719(+)
MAVRQAECTAQAVGGKRPLALALAAGNRTNVADLLPCHLGEPTITALSLCAEADVLGGQGKGHGGIGGNAEPVRSGFCRPKCPAAPTGGLVTNVVDHGRTLWPSLRGVKRRWKRHSGWLDANTNLAARHALPKLRFRAALHARESLRRPDGLANETLVDSRSPEHAIHLVDLLDGCLTGSVVSNAVSDGGEGKHNRPACDKS